MEAKETKLVLEARIQKKQIALEKTRQRNGLEGRSLVSVTNRLEKARADYREKAVMYTQSKDLAEDMKEDFSMRTKKFTVMLRHCEKVVRQNFDIYLNRKGFSGTVIFDHKKSTLSLTCQTDNTNDATRVDDVRQLSGGERSYTTLSLLLALGHVVSIIYK